MPKKGPGKGTGDGTGDGTGAANRRCVGDTVLIYWNFDTQEITEVITEPNPIEGCVLIAGGSIVTATSCLHQIGFQLQHSTGVVTQPDVSEDENIVLFVFVRCRR